MDRTIEIASQLADRVLHSSPGFSAARETARRQSRSEYLCFIDPGKYPADETTLSSLVSRLELDPRLGACQARIVIDAERARRNMLARAEQFRYSRYFLKDAGRLTDFVVTSATVFRASALERVGGFRQHLKTSDDGYMSIRLSEEGYGLFVSDEAVVVHQFDEGFTELLKKTIRGSRDSYLVYRLCHRKAHSFVARSTPFHAIVRGAKLAAVALADTKDIWLAGFVFFEVSLYHISFFLGFVTELIRDIFAEP